MGHNCANLFLPILWCSMADNQKSHNALPESFIKQVKGALEHLYDFPYLQRHPLAQESSSDLEAGETPSQRLRRQMVAAIETLNPGPDVPFRAPHARVYNLLLMRYVEGMTVQEAAHELGVSRRQAHRDLRRGEESVAAVMWSRRPAKKDPELSAAQLSSVQAEIDRLEIHPRPTNLNELLESSRQAVNWLASQRSVNLETRLPPEPVIIPTDPLLARQVLTNTLSQAVNQAQPGPLQTTLELSAETAILSLHYRPETENVEFVANDVINQLIERLDWKLQISKPDTGRRLVTLQMTARFPTVLVIDDNEGLVGLLSDYLSGHACRVTAASDGQVGLQLAKELIPDTIVLDVMMPEMDGWEILQRLRANPKTAEIPVIVCSVINNPELAYSLQASLFLTKPVSRDTILDALRQLKVV